MADCRICGKYYARVDMERTCGNPRCKSELRRHKTCKQCKEEFYAVCTGRGRTPQFCSPECRKVFSQAYHKKYDSKPEQLKRRRMYMQTYSRKTRKSTALENIGFDEIDSDPVRE